MKQKFTVIEETADRQCDCCGRNHRKLYIVDGYAMGTSCAKHYDIYKKWGEKDANIWRGWEKQLSNVKQMIARRKF